MFIAKTSMTSSGDIWNSEISTATSWTHFLVMFEFPGRFPIFEEFKRPFGSNTSALYALTRQNFRAFYIQRGLEIGGRR